MMERIIQKTQRILPLKIESLILTLQEEIEIMDIQIKINGKGKIERGKN